MISPKMLPHQNDFKAIIQNALSLEGVKDYFLVYKFGKSGINDIDIFLVVSKNTNFIKLISTMSRYMLPYIKATDICVACFPVEEKRFQNQETRFLKNIKADGKKIC